MGKNGNINNLLIPNVSKLPKHKNVDISNKLNPGEKSEFNNVLSDEIKTKAPADLKSGLLEKVDQVKSDHGINVSLHAAKRIKERNLLLENEDFFKIKNALGKLKEKGGQDSLIITDKAAFIVDVSNNKIVTAIDKGNLSENVFTKIDSTVVI